MIPLTRRLALLDPIQKVPVFIIARRTRRQVLEVWTGFVRIPVIPGWGRIQSLPAGVRLAPLAQLKLAERFIREDHQFQETLAHGWFCVFTEERLVPIPGDTASLNDGWFWSPTPGGANAWTVRDPPQIAHGGAVTILSFGDGHAETHKWFTSWFKTCKSGDSQLGNVDIAWLLNHSTQ